MNHIIVAILNLILPLIKNKINYKKWFERQNHYNNNEEEKAAAEKGKAKKIKQSEAEGIARNKKKEDSFKMFWPIARIPVKVTSPFGYRVIRGRRRFHNGVDYRSWDGKEIIAVERCVVKKIVPVDTKYPVKFKYNREKKKFERLNIPAGRGWTPYIVIHGMNTGNRYVYKHVKNARGLKVGQVKQAGSKLGIAGNYGYSLGAHLHFETYLSGDLKKPVDGHKYLRNKGLVKSNSEGILVTNKDDE